MLIESKCDHPSSDMYMYTMQFANGTVTFETRLSFN